MNTKYFLIGLGVVLLISGLVIWLINPFSVKDTSIPTNETKKNQKSLGINILPIESRPYFILEPKSSVEPQSLGHWVTFTISNTGKYTKMDYEFEYTTGSLIQGAMGSVDFQIEKPPVSKEIAFGTASKGKYKYDEGVTSGSFLLTLINDQDSVLKTEFNLQKMSDVDGVFTSPDGKVELKIGQNDLSANDYLIIANTLGLPEKISGQILSGPYGFYADSERFLNNSEIIFNEASKDSRIIFWDGKHWRELETNNKNNQTSDFIKSLGTYLLIK